RPAEDTRRLRGPCLTLDRLEERRAEPAPAVRPHDVDPAVERAIGTREMAWPELRAGGKAAIRRHDRDAEEVLRWVELLPLSPLGGRAALQLVHLGVPLVGPWLTVGVIEVARPISVRMCPGDRIEA